MDNISSVSERRRVVRQGTGSAQPGFQDDESGRRSVVIADEENIVTKDWLISMKDGGEQGSTKSKKTTQIQKVLPMLRLIKDNKEFYDPMVVSIGDEGKKMMKEFIKGEVMPPSRTGDKPQKGTTNFHAKKISDGGDGQPLHLLELLRTELVGECKDPDPVASQNGDWHSYRSVEELNTVGINFTRSDTFHLHNVSYKSHLIHGELSLPPIAVDDSTKHKFLNLIAYETCPDAPEDYMITSYICFLDSVIDNGKDVKELRSKGILLNSLGSDQQVADLFNQLSTNLVPDPIVYGDVKGKIEKHYKNKYRMAEIKHTHFGSPWSVIALLAGVFVIFITVIQTYFTVFPLK
ncbi:hypothetical protein HHK36_001545 [Tetracentron sinense]|uniref:Uncharacterized protein n=1 Tax=Tetracentron sinense TaxID=13715 RepID=A0A835DUT8_TETSI|nr:hypothetical protein HHK36_001545 [Tetracentron sinense]